MKIGDRVEYVGDGSYSIMSDWIGRKGTISRMDSYDGVRVLYDDGVEDFSYLRNLKVLTNGTDLVPIISKNFKVGDRVRSLVPVGAVSVNGGEGTILAVDTLASVRFDKDIFGHDTGCLDPLERSDGPGSA